METGVTESVHGFWSAPNGSGVVSDLDSAWLEIAGDDGFEYSFEWNGEDLLAPGNWASPWVVGEPVDMSMPGDVHSVSSASTTLVAARGDRNKTVQVAGATLSFAPVLAAARFTSASGTVVSDFSTRGARRPSAGPDFVTSGTVPEARARWAKAGSVLCCPTGGGDAGAGSVRCLWMRDVMLPNRLSLLLRRPDDHDRVPGAGIRHRHLRVPLASVLA